MCLGRHNSALAALLSQYEFKILYSDTWPERGKRTGQKPAAAAPAGSAERRRSEGSRGQGQTPHTTNAQFSALHSEFLPWPQSSFCIQDRDRVFNETCLARLLRQLPVPFIPSGNLQQAPIDWDDQGASLFLAIGKCLLPRMSKCDMLHTSASVDGMGFDDMHILCRWTWGSPVTRCKLCLHFY